MSTSPPAQLHNSHDPSKMSGVLWSYRAGRVGKADRTILSASGRLRLRYHGCRLSG
ncbi:MAG: hypothetical protein JWP75_3037 [Frondihabitans sp.]|nr:hypothetical protein [Frondihabitans sp.]